ncbi:MAG: GTPase ObgE [Thermomicrobiales bacterium]|nr:GTPase ObgE [Thermomicrobiales bacterium]
MLIDRARIYVKAGDGGNGSASFRREKYVPKGGPDGGDGGRGGNVRLLAQANLTSLLAFQFNQRFTAGAGGQGLSQLRHGKNGEMLTIGVPVGTVVWDDETDELLADLTEPDMTTIVARGGRGGLGNVHFKSSTRQAPRIAELGEPGQERWLRMELRLIADVGLVGLPNAGKSTLLAAASAARPKVADYPFTTLQPYLGVVEIGGPGGQTFVMADIPGLIEGAAEGAGLGHEFLRHVSRTKVLIHVLDASGGLEGRDPLADFRIINDELAAYDEAMAEKPMLVALNKIDLPEARERLPRLRRALEAEGREVFTISGVTGEGVPTLLRAAAEELRAVVEREAEEAAAEERKVYTLPEVDERRWEVTQISQHHFAVTGIGIERFTRMTNFDNEEGAERFQRRLESTGINAELTRQGILPGDVVHIAGQELVWGEEHELDEI